MNNFYNISPTCYGWGYGYGFFSNYRMCLEQIIIHHKNKEKTVPYIDWSKTTFVDGFNPFADSSYNGVGRHGSNVIIPKGNPFDLWFDQPIPQDNDKIDYWKGTDIMSVIDHGKHYYNEPSKLKEQQHIDELYIKPKKHILNKINEIYEKEFKDHVVLGVMARGCEYNSKDYKNNIDADHPVFGQFLVKDYIKGIKKILKENPDITKLFFASEEQEYVNELSKEFPNSYFMKDVFRRTDESMDYITKYMCWPNISAKRNNQCKLLGEETIIQTKLLGMSNYFYGRLSGIFTGTMLWGKEFNKVYKTCSTNGSKEI
jgi:hypothetical protein